MNASCDCALHPPSPLLEREASEDELDVEPWIARLPTAQRSSYARRIWRNQFGGQCDRLLLVYNDLNMKNPTVPGASPGLGASIRVYGSALLAAMESGRVLHELPAHVTGGNDWCGQPPYTLECHFARWSNCDLDREKLVNRTRVKAPKRGHKWGASAGLDPSTSGLSHPCCPRFAYLLLANPEVAGSSTDRDPLRRPLRAHPVPSCPSSLRQAHRSGNRLL